VSKFDSEHLFFLTTEQKSQKLGCNFKESLPKMAVNASILVQSTYYERRGKTKEYAEFKGVSHQGMSTRFVNTFFSIFETNERIGSS